MTDWLSPKVLAPLVHIFAGAAFLLATYLRVYPLSHTWFVLAQVAFLGVVLIKETLVDPVIETDQPFLWEGAKDVLGYIVGMGLAALIVLL